MPATTVFSNGPNFATAGASQLFGLISALVLYGPNSFQVSLPSGLLPSIVAESQTGVPEVVTLGLDGRGQLRHRCRESADCGSVAVLFDAVVAVVTRAAGDDFARVAPGPPLAADSPTLLPCGSYMTGQILKGMAADLL